MKTGLALIALLLASWTLEILGVQVMQFCWNAPLPGGSLAVTVAEAGNGMLRFLHLSATWTAASVTSALLAFYYWFHVAWLGLSLLWPKFERLRLGARQPNEWERQRYATARASLIERRASLAQPGRWMVADGPGLRMRWIGYVLVIDRPLLQHRHFTALLAHELGHANQEDRTARRLYAMLPSRQALILCLMGLPTGIGVLLLSPLWLWYWRARIYAADRYALRLGQGHALISALKELYLPLDRTTKFGRWLKPVPYIGTRIGRLERALEASAPAVAAWP